MQFNSAKFLSLYFNYVEPNKGWILIELLNVFTLLMMGSFTIVHNDPKRVGELQNVFVLLLYPVNIAFYSMFNIQIN